MARSRDTASAALVDLLERFGEADEHDFDEHHLDEHDVDQLADLLGLVGPPGHRRRRV
jgi:hypothetical protein